MQTAFEDPSGIFISSGAFNIISLIGLQPVKVSANDNRRSTVNAFFIRIPSFDRLSLLLIVYSFVYVEKYLYLIILLVGAKKKVKRFYS